VLREKFLRMDFGGEIKGREKREESKWIVEYGIQKRESS
jgi:hypothetical protein